MNKSNYLRETFSSADYLGFRSYLNSFHEIISH
jgi:hypothetical protein